MKDIVKLYDHNFEGPRWKNIEETSVVIFSADWCPYCVSFFNNWREYSKVEKAYIADITDVDSALWDSFDINVVPSMAVFTNEQLVRRWDGVIGQGLTIDQIEDVNSFCSNF